jgi:hypothetical protein
MTKTSTPKVGQTIRLTNVAPVSAAALGTVVTVTRVLPNAIITTGGIFHLRWGTKRNPGDLGYEVV